MTRKWQGNHARDFRDVAYNNAADGAWCTIIQKINPQSMNSNVFKQTNLLQN
jgi:hypothetical protein